MLKHFTYSVTFPSTGKEFGATVDFETGLTVITGSNEAGKSLILEMIRYSLFGKAALRGGASDYKTLKTRLVFQAGQHEYVVTKSHSKEILRYNGGEEIAVGASVLNTKIPELLGFGLKVFDTSCSCNQGEIEALGNMKPTERRRMVDSVIGLTVLEDLEAWAKAEASSELRTVEALRLNLPARPVEPGRPEFYEPSDITKAALEDIQKQLNRKAEINGFLSSEPKKPAPAPARPSIEGTLEELKAKYDRQVGLEKMLADTQRKHDAIPDAAHTHEQLDVIEKQLKDYSAYQENQRAIKARGPKPVITPEQAYNLERNINDYHDWEIKRDLLAKGEHECPSCNHKWPVADLGKYADVEEIDKPVATLQYVRSQRECIATWATPLAELPAVETPALSVTDVNFHRQSIDKAVHKQDYKATILGYGEQLEGLKDAHSNWQTMDHWASLMKAYEIENKAYLDWTVKADELKLELAGIKDDQAIYDAMNKTFLENLSFERDYQAYNDKLREFNSALFTIGQHTATQESFTATAQGLKELRAKVKQFLVPSLNRVSSILLTQMTGGARTKVEINEEFEILIDGQPLNTLSGSGKAVANLAIRIGLGQVLTSKVFPIFMADEIDAAMDQERSNYTTDCLRGLSSVITQVILVTHKRPDADFYVDGGKGKHAVVRTSRSMRQAMRTA